MCVSTKKLQLEHSRSKCLHEHENAFKINDSGTCCDHPNPCPKPGVSEMVHMRRTQKVLLIIQTRSPSRMFHFRGKKTELEC